MAMTLSERRADYDVLIIGGGVNGTGLRETSRCADLRTLLAERNDLAFGASGNSSGMIHGGPRYLTSHPEVTRSSCLDSGYIQRIAPHMIFRIPFMMPIYGNGVRGAREARCVRRVLLGVRPLPAVEARQDAHTRLKPDEAARVVPGLNTANIAGCVISFDEWGINGTRLCVANALDAEEHGATVLIHTTVEKVHVEHGSGDRRAPSRPPHGRGARDHRDAWW
jgi:glycerol-3-phosphate dehydrogenase